MNVSYNWLDIDIEIIWTMSKIHRKSQEQGSHLFSKNKHCIE